MFPAEGLGALPHWELDSIYPGLESEPFRNAMTELSVQLDHLDKILDEYQTAMADAAQPAYPQDEVEALTRIIECYLDRMNVIATENRKLHLYVQCIVDTDSSNSLAARRLSELDPYDVRIQHQITRFQSWLRKKRELLDQVISKSELARSHAFYLQSTADQSRYVMSEAEEALAAELATSGLNAWYNLYAKIWSQLSVPFERNGKREDLPLSEIQNLAMFDPDGAVRERAAQAEATAWASMREPLAAALNGSKGAKIALHKRRGRTSPLHAALDEARIDQVTLEALLSAIQGALPAFHWYLKAKARLLGKETLAWWDIYAPVGQADRQFPFSKAQAFILTQFASFSPRLAGFARQAFNRHWIDAEPRAGKQGNAYCAGVPGLDLSRILINYDGSLRMIFGLTHELGHAFHNHLRAGKTLLQCAPPMTLAESASLFCETLVTEKALADAANLQEELVILDTFLSGTAFVSVIETTQYYHFEQEVFERRSQAALSADEICKISLRWQAEIYGNGIEPQHLNPYAWVDIPHQFFPNISFYNFPYAFGLLFSLGLYAQYQRRGAAFISEFEALLTSTGEYMPVELAARFGIRLNEPDFWQSSLRIIEQRIERFEAICGQSTLFAPKTR